MSSNIMQRLHEAKSTQSASQRFITSPLQSRAASYGVEHSVSIASGAGFRLLPASDSKLDAGFVDSLIDTLPKSTNQRGKNNGIWRRNLVIDSRPLCFPVSHA